MGQTSKIEWTDATWNPWQGCTKISPACEHCYMFTDLKRYGRDGSIVVRSKPPTFNLPLKKKQGGGFAIAPGSKVFTCSWSDWFHPAADPWRAEAWDIIRQRPDVTFQIVTKRIDRAADHLPADWGDGWPNVWIIVTVENQEWADKRIPTLLRTPAAVRGLSIEPLLGPIDIGLSTATCSCCARWPSRWIQIDRVVSSDIPFAADDGSRVLPGTYRASSNPHGALSVTAANGTLLGIKPDEMTMLGSIDWVIVGGESGPKARPMHWKWVWSLRDQCNSAGVPFFFKQWGEWESGQKTPMDYEKGASSFRPGLYHDFGDDSMALRLGKADAGRLLGGREWNEFPKQLEAVQ